MKQVILFICFLVSSPIFSQENRIDPHIINENHVLFEPNVEEYALTNDENVDINFYHLHLNIGIDHKYIDGQVDYLATSNKDDLNTIRLDLNEAFTIDSITGNIASYQFENRVLSINFNDSYKKDEVISFSVYYQGVPKLINNTKGLRYEKHDGGVPIIVSLSTPFLAHAWWPCKDGTFDKADSTHMDITIKDTTINDIPLMAIANGILTDVSVTNNYKTYKWKHNYPSVPYYIMVAISNFKQIEHTYNGISSDFPLNYYVFDSHYSSAQSGIADMPKVMDFFIKTFGPYPFSDEGYAMTQLGFYGGIENQTNSIVNNMGLSWFNVSVHELAHQWFADMITCETWNHGWLNEGFASYAEALYIEESKGIDSYHAYVANFKFLSSGSIWLDNVTDPFNVFRSIIYNKGAYFLHMLRRVVGDEDFFEIIYKYATDESLKYHHANTEDFQSYCEQISGKDLNTFFNQWIYDERYPTYEYNYELNDDNNTLDLSLIQTQETNGWRPVFEMPIDVLIKFEDGTDSLITIVNDKISQQFELSINKQILNIEIDPNNWILCRKKFNPDLVLGTNDLLIAAIAVYPNPTNNIINISIPNSISNKNITIKLYNNNGTLLFNQKYKTNAPIQINTTKLHNGLYTLHATSNNQLYHSKIIIAE